jgi:hypothetical protein
MKVYNITMQKPVEDELMRLQAKRKKSVRRVDNMNKKNEFITC